MLTVLWVFLFTRLFLTTWILMTDSLGKTLYFQWLGKWYYSHIWILSLENLRRDSIDLILALVTCVSLQGNIKYKMTEMSWGLILFQIPADLWYWVQTVHDLHEKVRVLPFGSTKGTEQATDHFYYISRGCAMVLPAKAIQDMNFMFIMTQVPIFIQDTYM